MNLEFSQQIFEKKHSNIKFREDSSSVVPCGGTEGPTWRS